MSGYTKQGNTWYLNGKQVNVGDQGYDQYGNLNQLQSDGTWRTLQKRTKEGIEARKNGLYTPNQYKKWKPSNQDTEVDNSFSHRLLKGLGLGDTAATVGEMAAYLTPAGNFISLVNAGDAFLRGDWKNGLLNAAFALPIIGNTGRIMKTGIQAAKLSRNFRTARNLQRVANTADAVGKTAGWGIAGSLGYDLTKGIASGIKDTMAEQDQDKNDVLQMYNQAKQAGYSDADISRMMGQDNFNQFKSFIQQ